MEPSVCCGESFPSAATGFKGQSAIFQENWALSYLIGLTKAAFVTPTTIIIAAKTFIFLLALQTENVQMKR